MIWQILDAAIFVGLLAGGWIIARLLGFTHYVNEDKKWAAIMLWLGLGYAACDMLVEYKSEATIREHVMRSARSQFIRAGTDSDHASETMSPASAPERAPETVSPLADGPAAHPPSNEQECQTIREIFYNGGREVVQLARYCIDQNGQWVPAR